MSKKNCEALFLSDTHLFSKGCRLAKLRQALKALKPQRVFLVGDVIDFWMLNPRMSNGKKRTEHVEKTIKVLRSLLKKIQKGSHLTYLWGNHDSYLELLGGFGTLGIEIRKEAFYEGTDGRSYLVTHGDQWDKYVRGSQFLPRLLSWAQEYLWSPAETRETKWSLSEQIHKNVSRSIRIRSEWERHATDYASSKGYTGVICGHTHEPEDKMEGDIRLVNCGDWVIHNSFAIDLDGELRLIMSLEELNLG